MAFALDAPDFRPLQCDIERLLAEHGPLNLAVIKRHTLLETIYKKAHAKTAVDALVANHRIQQTQSGRSDTDRIYELRQPSEPATLF
ncbi:MAG: hypothetical protein JNL54_18720 [Kineosporiaceae bacterium]|nr:hypothetical protein [Kineosporiaceae bacterium]